MIRVDPRYCYTALAVMYAAAYLGFDKSVLDPLIVMIYVALGLGSHE